MNSKYIGFYIVGFIAILGWNAFLIQRDNAMFKEYYHRQKLEYRK